MAYSLEPWTVDEDPDGWWITGADKQANVICDLIPRNIKYNGPEIIREYDDEDRANAALLAAAPKLLRACKAVIKWRGLDGDSITDPVRSLVIAAIAEAELKEA